MTSGSILRSGSGIPVINADGNLVSRKVVAGDNNIQLLADNADLGLVRCFQLLISLDKAYRYLEGLQKPGQALKNALENPDMLNFSGDTTTK